jgi:hypothetical protein
MEFDTSPARIAEIEARARVLRAEAARDGMRSMTQGIAHALASLFGRRTNAA